MRLLLFLGISIGLCAQEPAPKLEFTGKPILVPFACTEETAQAANLSCSEVEPCPVFLELANLEAVGDKLFLVGNLHSSANTFSSILLTSDDQGKTWSEVHERIPQAVIEGIQFIDFANGWVSGQTLAQLPRDPFFLITNDGGKTWKKRPMFEDNRVGVIDAFYFDSKSDGMLILDRTRGGESNSKYEQYETKTSGDTWMLLEVSSRQLKLKKTKPPMTEIRIHADAPSKTYRIEQLKAGKWNLLSSFAVRLPECRVTPQELKPPPEPEPTPEPEPVKPTGPRKPPSLKKKP